MSRIAGLRKYYILGLCTLQGQPQPLCAGLDISPSHHPFKHSRDYRSIKRRHEGTASDAEQNTISRSWYIFGWCSHLIMMFIQKQKASGDRGGLSNVMLLAVLLSSVLRCCVTNRMPLALRANPTSPIHVTYIHTPADLLITLGSAASRGHNVTAQ